MNFNKQPRITPPSRHGASAPCGVEAATQRRTSGPRTDVILWSRQRGHRARCSQVSPAVARRPLCRRRALPWPGWWLRSKAHRTRRPYDRLRLTTLIGGRSGSGCSDSPPTTFFKGLTTFGNAHPPPRLRRVLPEFPGERRLLCAHTYLLSAGWQPRPCCGAEAAALRLHCREEHELGLNEP